MQALRTLRGTNDRGISEGLTQGSQIALQRENGDRLKRCRQCRQDKPHAEFYQDRRYADRYYPYCRACKSAAVLARWLERKKEAGSEKVCGRCEECLPVSEFGYAAHRWDNRNLYCKDCIRVTVNEKRQLKRRMIVSVQETMKDKAHCLGCRGIIYLSEDAIKGIVEAPELCLYCVSKREPEKPIQHFDDKDEPLWSLASKAQQGKTLK